MENPRIDKCLQALAFGSKIHIANTRAGRLRTCMCGCEKGIHLWYYICTIDENKVWSRVSAWKCRRCTMNIIGDINKAITTHNTQIAHVFADDWLVVYMWLRAELPDVYGGIIEGVCGMAKTIPCAVCP